MALGGGAFLTPNKTLPGAYINFVSAARASANLGERGRVAMPLELDWGPDGEIFTITNGQFQAESLKYFGYDYGHEKLRGLRDLFKNAHTAYLYRLNSGTQATNLYGKARYSGLRGNDLKVTVEPFIEDETKFVVSTLLEIREMDQQIVAAAGDLVDNDYLIWDKTATLEAALALPLTGGTNKTALTGADYQAFLDKIESYNFNTLGTVATTAEITNLFLQFTKRMRDQVGVKFQTILYRTIADYEGVIALENATTDRDWPVSALIYWALGAQAGCPINKSTLNKIYDGEFTPNCDYTQRELETGIKTGKFLLHQVGGKPRVLADINSLVSHSEEKNADFAQNQTIRVLDQIANDMAILFNNRYLGQVPNDEAGRLSFWSDLVKHHQELQKLRAIENFKADDVTVTKGDNKQSVIVQDRVTPTNAMAQLYMTIVVA